MKRYMWKGNLLIIMAIILAVGFGMHAKVFAKSTDDTILEGIYISDLNVSGMTKEEAEREVEAMVDNMKNAVVTLKVNEEHSVEITPSDIGLTWKNTNVVEEAVNLGKQGNIVQRYKAIKDLQYGTMVFDLDIAVDKNLLAQLIQEQCSVYDIPAQDMTLVRENGAFQITGGQTGIEVNVAESAKAVEAFLTKEWDYKDAQVALVIQETQPRGTKEELSLVKDVLGTFTTSYSTSGSSRSANVANGCSLINGTVLYPGDEFSTYDTIKPFTEENGYKLAGSYLNGMVVESLGGGICQVSTTLYNAVLLAELEVTERYNHSMIISYVKPSMDAAIAESSGKDFKFVNSTEHPIYIEGHTENKNIIFTIYGVEYRDAGHKVRYESEVLKTTQPETEKIIASASQGVGFINVQSAHIGYVAQLWKIVTENGTEVSREVINESTYNVSPRTATVGVNTDNASYAARIQEAIASGSIDQCKAVAGAIRAEMENPPAPMTEEEALAAYYQALAAQQAAAQAQ